MADIFISYCRADYGSAERLAGALHNAGFSVWWDQELLGGTRFDDVIVEQLQMATTVIVLWSEAAIQSDWVLKEAKIGLKRDCLIPVKLDACKVPVICDGYHILDLNGWNGEADDRLRRLIRSVHSVQKRAFSAATDARTPWFPIRKAKSLIAISSLALLGVFLSGIIPSGNRIGQIGGALTGQAQDGPPVDGGMDRNVIKAYLTTLELADKSDEALIEALVRTGRFDAALTLLSGEHAQQKDQLPIEASNDLLHQIGALAYYVDADVALRTYREIITADPKDRLALAQLGRLHLDRHEWAQAQDYLRRAEEEEPYSERERLHLAMDIIVSDQSRFDEAPTRFARLAEEAQTLGEKSVRAYALSMAASYEIYAQNVTDERLPKERLLQLATVYSEALAVHEQLNDLRGIMVSYGGLGGVYNMLGEYQTSLAYQEKAYAIARSLGQRLGAYFDCTNIADAYAQLGQWEKARQYNSEAFALANEINLLEYTYSNWRISAMIAASEGELEKACEQLNSAKAIGRDYPVHLELVGKLLDEYNCPGSKDI